PSVRHLLRAPLVRRVSHPLQRRGGHAQPPVHGRARARGGGGHRVGGLLLEPRGRLRSRAHPEGQRPVLHLRHRGELLDPAGRAPLRPRRLPHSALAQVRLGAPAVGRVLVGSGQPAVGEKEDSMSAKKSLVRFLPLALAGMVAVATPGRGQSATYYVATYGNDATGNGSLTMPWATIEHALGAIPDGSTILVRPGTYTGRVRLQRVCALGCTIRSEVPYQAVLRNNDQVVT